MQQNLWIFALLAVWEIVWKGMALWRAAKLNQKYWFIALILINTVGVLPIIYLLIQKERKS
ncbi:MAG TPA: DUF5652 family protein [Patescibacteria group bacterium]|nr:DUF5652 family protein [Patescibacteria group bacterium]